MLTHGRAQTEELTLFIKGTTEVGGSVTVPKTTHRVVPLSDAAMILFNAIIELGIAAVHHFLDTRHGHSSSRAPVRVLTNARTS